MSKKLFILFFLFGTVFLFLLGIILVFFNTSESTYPDSQATQEQTTGSVLFFTPNPLILETQKENSASVILQPGTDAPQTVQLEIAYNPTQLLNMQIVPGDYFINPTILLNTLNTNTGRVSFALEASLQDSNKKTPGTVAILTFTPYSALPQQQTTLSFLQKTTVKNAEGKAILKEARDAKLLFTSLNGLTATPTLTVATPSATPL